MGLFSSILSMFGLGGSKASSAAAAVSNVASGITSVERYIQAQASNVQLTSVERYIRNNS